MSCRGIIPCTMTYKTTCYSSPSQRLGSYRTTLFIWELTFYPREERWNVFGDTAWQGWVGDESWNVTCMLAFFAHDCKWLTTGITTRCHSPIYLGSIRRFRYSLNRDVFPPHRTSFFTLFRRTVGMFEWYRDCSSTLIILRETYYSWSTSVLLDPASTP